MPQRTTATLLCEILESAEAIQDFTTGLSYDSYRANLLIRSGVERQLELLAEAAFRLRPTIHDLCPAIDWHAVYGLGNFLRHEYHAIRPRTLWDAVHHEIPPLAAAVRKALQTIHTQQQQPPS